MSSTVSFSAPSPSLFFLPSLPSPPQISVLDTGVPGNHSSCQLFPHQEEVKRQEGREQEGWKRLGPSCGDPVLWPPREPNASPKPQASLPRAAAESLFPVCSIDILLLTPVAQKPEPGLPAPPASCQA